jgi:hypothetical protein
MLDATLTTELETFKREYTPYLRSLIIQDGALLVITQEGLHAVIHVTDAGWSYEQTSTAHATPIYFPTSHALLSHLSPAFNEQWAGHLFEALSKLSDSAG